MKYLSGDTIRLEITVLDLKGDEYAPDTITVSVYDEDETLLLDAGMPMLLINTISCYYYDWLIPVVEKKSELTVVWDWTGPHRKKKEITVVPTVET